MTTMENVTYLSSPQMESILTTNKTPVVRPCVAHQSRPMQFTSALNDSEWTFQYLNNNKNTLISKLAFIEFYASLSINNTAGGHPGPIDEDNSDFCPAANALLRVCSSIEVSINGASVTMNPNYILNALERLYITDEHQKYYNNLQQDPMSNPRAFGRASVNTPIQADNPFGVGRQFGNKSNRACIQPISYSTATNTTTFNYKITCPLLFHPFFTSDVFSNETIPLVNSLSVSLKFNSDKSALFTVGNVFNGADDVSSTVVISASLTPTTATQPVLRLQTFESSADVPDSAMLPFYQYQVLSYDQSTALLNPALDNAANTAPSTPLGVYSSQDINFMTVPEKILIYVNKTANPTARSGTGFMSIESLKVYKNSTGTLFGEYSPDQLYADSVRAGLNMTHYQFRRNLGSVIVLDTLNSAIGSEIAGLVAQGLSLRFEVSCLNYTIDNWVNGRGSAVSDAANVAYSDVSLRVVGILPSRLMLTQNGATIAYGSFDSGTTSTVVNEMEVATANRTLQPISAVDPKLSAGSFKQFFRGFKNGLKETADVVQPLASLAMTGAKLGSMMGAGFDNKNLSYIQRKRMEGGAVHLQ